MELDELLARATRQLMQPVKPLLGVPPVCSPHLQGAVCQCRPTLAGFAQNARAAIRVRFPLVSRTCSLLQFGRRTRYPANVEVHIREVIIVASNSGCLRGDCKVDRAM